MSSVLLLHPNDDAICKRLGINILLADKTSDVDRTIKQAVNRTWSSFFSAKDEVVISLFNTILLL